MSVMSIVFRRAVSAAALAAALTGCTPLQVVTHTVTQTEARVPVGQYKLDPHHTSVIFNVDHLKYTRFTMRFDRVAGEIDWKEGGLDKSQVTVTIDAASIDTNVPLLDKMVKGADMLDVERNPQIRFVTTRFERTGDARGKLTGDLTIRGVTQAVTLDVTFNGYGRDPLTKADTLGFSADGQFSRSKFGLTTWYPAVGDDIRVVIQAEAARPPAS
ncbi:YceI family protein [Paraburkholderia phymatum]|nr:YceI family protein [Paraburkholderia phymatum]